MNEFLQLMKESETFGTDVAARAKQIVNFNEKLAAFTNLIGNKEGLSQNRRRFLMKEAETTSDFPVLFGTVLERTLRMKYKLQSPDWRKYVKVGTQNDFRTAWDMATYGNRATLGVVKERGEYPNAKLADGKFTINLQKFGRQFGLSWEAVINDDLGAFTDIASDLTLSALNTESYNVASLFSTATGVAGTTGGPNTTLYQVAGSHPIDGAAFTNKYTGAGTALSAAALATAVTNLKSQKDYDGNPILFNRFILVTPIALEFTALQVLSQNALIASALSSNSSTSGVLGTTSENVIAKYPITSCVNPWLDIIGGTYGKTAWFLFGDPADGDAVKFNFLRGHENPEVVQKMSDKISLGGGPISPLEGDFDSDSILWRVRHVMGGTVTDPRYTQYNQGQ